MFFVRDLWETQDTKQEVISEVSYDFIYKGFYNYSFIIRTLYQKYFTTHYTNL